MRGNRQLVPERAVGRRGFSDEQGPEVLFCLMHVVRPAPKLEVLSRRRTSLCKRADVVELEEASFGAPLRAPDECTLPRVASRPLASPPRARAANRVSGRVAASGGGRRTVSFVRDPAAIG